MATLAVTSAYNNQTASENFAFEDESNTRDTSFSCYQNGRDASALVVDFEKSTRILPSTVNASTEPPPNSLSFGRKYNEDGELGIFSAEKYFSGRMDETGLNIDEKITKQCFDNEEKVDPPRPRKTYKSATPSACSDSSWNSQSALLQRDRNSNMQRQMGSKKFFNTFGCNCAGKKATDIDEKVGKNTNPNYCRKIFDLREETNTPQIVVNGPIGVPQTRPLSTANKHMRSEYHGKESINTELDDRGVINFKNKDHFAFPILNSELVSLTVGDENARASLEVFGATHMIKENLHKRSNMLSPSRCQVIDLPTKTGSIDNEDLASESSSDLFEIESFSSKVHHPFFYPHGLDSMSSCTATPSRYEPSEASIAWSVVTASAANFSVASDFDCERRLDQEGIIRKTSTMATNRNGTSKAIVSKEAQRRQSSTSLLGCKSNKAVSVVRSAHKVPENLNLTVSKHFEQGSKVPFARSHAEKQSTEFNPTHALCTSAMIYLSPSEPAQLSHSLYM